MPYKSEKIKIAGGEFDGRVKLSPEQKEEIQQMYKTKKYSWQDLAVLFNVSRSTIGYVVNPKIAERLKKRIQIHWRDYSNRRQLSEAIKKTRLKKQTLYKEGKITLEE